MQQANKLIYFTTNCLIERFWIGQISIRKGQQNTPVEPLKSNLMGPGMGGRGPDCLIRGSIWMGPRVPGRVLSHWQNDTLLQSKHDIKGELSAVNFENTRQDRGMIQQHLSKWDISLYLTESECEGERVAYQLKENEIPLMAGIHLG